MSGAIRKEVTIGDCRLILGDCLEVMPLLGNFDAVLTDPPYGIGESAAKNNSRSILAKATDYGSANWDQNPASPEAISLIRKASKWQVIFGGNYFSLPPTSCWLVWDKENGENDFADCELAWTNIPKAVRRIKWMWHGMIRKGGEKRVHLTQKPLGVMEWALGHVPEPNQTILDPFMGSGTTGVACVKLGRKFTGVEIDPDYFEIACKRIQAAYDEPDMFIEAEKPKAVQEDLDL